MKYSVLALTIALLSGCQTSKSFFNRTSIPSDEDFASVLYLNDHAGHAASGFLHIRNGKLYIVTAKHFAGYMSGHDSVGILLDGEWKLVATRLIGHATGDVDISVFVFDKPIDQKAFNLTPALSNEDSIGIGCEVWYLGFPLGYRDTDPQRRYPYPVPKHGYLAIRAGHPAMYYFDGNCNPGYSGGPVFARATDGNLRLIGVVSYRVEEVVSPEITTDAGLFAAYSVEYADSLIDKNPIGMQLH